MKTILIIDKTLTPYEAGMQKALKVGLKFLKDNPKVDIKIESAQGTSLMGNPVMFFNCVSDDSKALMVLLNSLGITTLMTDRIIQHILSIQSVGYVYWLKDGIDIGMPQIDIPTDEQLDMIIVDATIKFIESIQSYPIIDNYMKQYYADCADEKQKGLCDICKHVEQCNLMKTLMPTIMMFALKEIEIVYGSYNDFEKEMKIQKAQQVIVNSKKFFNDGKKEKL